MKPFALASSRLNYERSRPFHLKHLKLSVSLDLEQKQVEGEALWTFERRTIGARWLELDAVGFIIDGVSFVGGAGIPFEYDGDRLVIALGDTIHTGAIRIVYRAKPSRGLYFLEPDQEVPQRPVQVWSQCQDEDARHWFPCHDKPHEKMTLELSARVPPGMLVLSNGELTHQELPEEAAWTYHFSMRDPLPSYLVTLVAGSFVEVADRDALLGSGDAKRSVLIRYFVAAHQADAVKRSFGETPRMVELFSRLTGFDYPFSRYSQIVVSDFIFGGMENTTATTLHEHVLLDEKAAVDNSSNDLIAHELAHQWFGDLLTCRDWTHAWLNEGFATFFEHLEREDRLGIDEYEYGVYADLKDYLAEADGRYQRPIVCREYENPMELFDRHLYQKGALVLHMLRRTLGDDYFFAGIRNYVQAYRGGVVETNDLLRAFDSVSGIALDQFFDEWVFRPGHPVLKVSIAYDEELLSVRVRQSQKPPTFSLPLEVLVVTSQGDVERHQKRMHTAHDTLSVRYQKKPRFVVVDPDFKLATQVKLTCPKDMLCHQLAEGVAARHRWLAAQALAERGDLPSVVALSKALLDSTAPWMVRSEAAGALGRIRGETAFQALEQAVNDEHPKVRRAVASSLGEYRTDASAHLLARLAKSDPSYLVEAEASRSLGRTRRPIAKETLPSLLSRASWYDVTRAGALDGLAELRDESLVPTFVEHSRYGRPNRGRAAAISGLSRISESRSAREHLEDLLDDRDPYLRIEVIKALSRLGNRASREALGQRLKREQDARVVRRLKEALRDLVSHSDPLKADELEGLKAELSDLRVRLSELETRFLGAVGKKKKSKKEGK